jgi:hypothetical protein
VHGAGYKYRDRPATPQGITAMTLRSAATASHGRMRMEGRGMLLDVPMLGLTPPVVARLVRSDAAACWEATYSTPMVNDANTFQAKSD